LAEQYRLNLLVVAEVAVLEPPMVSMAAVVVEVAVAVAQVGMAAPATHLVCHRHKEITED